MSIKERVKAILTDLPPGVTLVAAAKGHTPEEIREAVTAGIQVIGENYLQEAEPAYAAIGGCVQWHFIGHLQRNKVKKAVYLFDMIETVDSLAMAEEIDRRCREIGKTMPVLIEVNSGREPQKSGVLPEDAEKVVTEVSRLPNLRVMGLMTMGPPDADALRLCFREMRHLFERLRAAKLPGADMRYLSMGMTDSYRLAIEEGANVVRIGSKIFGARG